MCFMSGVALRRRRRILLRVRAAMPLVELRRDTAASVHPPPPRATPEEPARDKEPEQDEQEREEREEPEAEPPRPRPYDYRDAGARSGDDPAALGDAVGNAEVVGVDTDRGEHRDH